MTPRVRRSAALLFVVGVLVVAATGTEDAGAENRSVATAHPRMSQVAVTRAALAIMAANARRLRLRRRVADAEVASMTLVRPGQHYTGLSGHRAGRVESVLWWAVEVRGTMLNCGGTPCGASPPGELAIADATGRSLGGGLGGHVTIIPVTSLRHP